MIKEKLIAESEARLKKGKVDVSKLDRELGDGPLKLSEEQKQRRMRQLLGETNDPVSARVGLERIINGNDLDNINYLAKGIAASHPVCRIQLKDSGGNLVGYASGFLIGPGVLMTNHHVFGSKEDARNSLADFDYELDVNGNERPVTHFAFRPDDLFYTNQELDYSVVAVAQKSADGARDISEWGWLPLNGEPGKGDPGEYLTIIQHPSGEVKQVCVRENKLLKYMEHMVWYATDTLGGSSGSPVFNRFWQVVALHHSGVPRKNSKSQTLTKDGKVWDASMHESLIDWEANEGIRISVIVADLNAALGNDPRVRQVLRVLLDKYRSAGGERRMKCGVQRISRASSGAQRMLVSIRSSNSATHGPHHVAQTLMSRTLFCALARNSASFAASAGSTDTGSF